MFRNEYHAVVGFTKTMDRTCPTCGGIYASNEHSNCPKCGQYLVVPTVKTQDNTMKPYCFTEVTIYPILPSKEKERYAEEIKKSKSLPFIVRLKLWGHYDEANNIVTPNNRVPYLLPKRQILVNTVTPPKYKVFHTKEGVAVLEIMHNIGAGDVIKFLDSKESMTKQLDNHEKYEANNPPPAPAPNPSTTPAPIHTPGIDAVNALMEEFKAMQIKMAQLTQSMAKPAPVTTRQAVVNESSPDVYPEVEYPEYNSEEYDYSLFSE